jgi:hypothetical protein
MSLLLAMTGRPSITIPDVDVVQVGDTPPVTAELIFFNNGTLVGSTVNELWYSVLRIGIGSFYQIKATSADALMMTGAFDSWLNLSTSPVWAIASNVGSKTATVTYEIRAVGQIVVIASGDITFTAEVI